ncbi:hypothetical protein DPMN_114290 [Dreissena polymorpha]|uniref:Uncharacterized protein n=2 Tax=Dreissena polymorpha TaxID=45954 RepID=A0A9D4KJT8_DREPO|nr:hypothetical protein DPMN_114290 [Dreissena polymorpha]
MFRESLRVISENQTESWEVFHFGSQSEGTTTPGLQSDIDELHCDNTVNVMIKKAGMENILKVDYDAHEARWCDINAVINLLDWKAGMMNVLMLRDKNTPPQQYLVQIFRKDMPVPETFLCNPRFVRKATGEILLSSERIKDAQEYSDKAKYGEVGHFTKQGPSLQEIQHWVDKKRLRHWPSKNLLEAARVAACFLVPVGAGVKGWEEAPFAFCVKFVPHEAYCVPYILLYEMARGQSEEEVAQRNYYDKQWMHCAEVDARVFLYYMQCIHTWNTHRNVSPPAQQLASAVDVGLVDWVILDDGAPADWVSADGKVISSKQPMVLFMVHNLVVDKLLSPRIILMSSSGRVCYPRRDGYRDDSVLGRCGGAEGFLTSDTRGSCATSQEATPT